MSKRIMIISSVLTLVFATAIPVYAQIPSPSISQTNQSFFGEIASFFSTIFHHQSGQGLNSGQGQTQSGPMEGGEQMPGASTGAAMMPRPSGQPNYLTLQQYRLSQLVKEGKITQAQEQEILTELTSVQNQLQSWAEANGINPSYVMGVPMMFGQGQQQGEIHPTGYGQQGQMHPMYQYKGGYREGGSPGGFGGQTGGQGGSQQNGGQPPQQGQSQP